MTDNMFNDAELDENDLEDILEERLKTISTDKDFLVGIYSMVCDYPEDMQEVIDFIDEGDEVTYENVILLANSLCQDHQPADFFED